MYVIGWPVVVRLIRIHRLRVNVCAERREVQEGSSPSGAQMRGAISKSGGSASLAEESRRYGEV